MSNLSENISAYRKSCNLTQKELGDLLNVTAQAVSKWENGQAEPDASTMTKLSEIFKISTDKLLGIETPAHEAVAAEVAAPAAPVTPAPQKLICGNCKTCKKPLSLEEAVIINHRTGERDIYCKECNQKRIVNEQRARNSAEYYEHKRTTTKSFIWGAVAGVIGLAVFLIVVLTDAEMKSDGLYVGVAVVMGVSFFTFVTQMFWDGFIDDMFFFFLKSFKMPGVIFTLDLDGIIFLILVKVFGAILSVLLSVVFFLIGLIITPLFSLVIFPFALIKRIAEGKKLKAQAKQ